MEVHAHRVREHIVDMCSGPEGGHLGGSLSAVEILVALFFHTMDLDPADPEWKDRDAFVLSKGHAAMALYATLAERNFIEAEEIGTFCRTGSRLATHVNVSVPGVEFATGSLGHGLALANGTAWAQRQAGGRPARTFVLVGDGELQEGSVWEAAQVGRALGADNLVVVIDANEFQQTGAVRDVSDGAPIAGRWAGFGWHTVEVDGHDLAALCAAFDEAARTEGPTAVVCRTQKAKGVGVLAGRAVSHFVRLDEAKLRRIRAGMRRPVQHAATTEETGRA
ncbi:transketolase [Streptomyces roseicoloratus]|uniref:Transketolase n=1 Tax=Streptomyces roseicoloratus TaxID=2508722 RepID=A0ABY9RXS2_9ACTN|nr:transketolase [Streptomyces roseicoloratus]WMX46972.1 transketolase [Streptomyces roseicoloratus]